MIKHLLFIAIGGATGSVLRYLVSIITARFNTGHFPLPTLVVNITGCFLIGFILARVGHGHQENQLRFLLVTGFCGGYTTFSAFSYENIQLINNGHGWTAVGYIFASVVAGVAAVWLGLKAA